MRSLYMLLVFGIASTVLFSCSENSSSPDNQVQLQMDDYFPLTQGSWWVYQNYTIDSLGNSIPSGETDSIYVGPTAVIDGKEAKSQISVSITDGEFMYDTAYFYIDGSKLYIYQQGFMDFSSNQWTLYFDLNATEWQLMHNEEHTDTVIVNPLNGENMVMKSDVVIDYPNGNKKYTIDGNNIDAKGIKMLMTMTSSWQIGEEKDTSSESNSTLIWLGKNVGLVNHKSDGFDNEIGGSEAILIRYQINQ